MTEPLERTPRMQITATESPAPPWAGVRFTCEKCQGEFQLEAADVCELVDGLPNSYYTPHCPTEGCGHINILSIQP